jgi:hypothetical protein
VAVEKNEFIFNLTMASNDLCLAFFSFLAGCVVVGLSVGYIVFGVYGITFLVHDYGVSHACAGSSLWAYALTAVILAFLRLSSVKSAKERHASGEEAGCGLVCFAMIEFGLAIWGGIELYQKSCPGLRESDLWLYSRVAFILQLVCGSIAAAMPLILCCGACLSRAGSTTDELTAFSSPRSQFAKQCVEQGGEHI